jgi:hypothetical protein
VAESPSVDSYPRRAQTKANRQCHSSTSGIPGVLWGTPTGGRPMKSHTLVKVAAGFLGLSACAPVPPPKSAIQATVEILPGQTEAINSKTPYCAVLRITGQNFPSGSQVQLAAVGQLPSVFAQSLAPTTATGKNTISSSSPAVIFPNPLVQTAVAPGCEQTAYNSSITVAIVAFDPTLQSGASTTVVVSNACPSFAPSQADVTTYCHGL